MSACEKECVNITNNLTKKNAKNNKTYDRQTISLDPVISCIYCKCDDVIMLTSKLFKGISVCQNCNKLFYNYN